MSSRQGVGSDAVSSPPRPPEGRRGVLIEGPIGRTLLVFSLPMLASNVLQSLNASINAAWIGHLLGVEALTASANANSVLFFLLSICFGLGMAVSILIGQTLGAGDLSRAKRIIGTAWTFFGLLSLGMAAIGVMAAPWVLAAMGTPPDALPLAAAYLRVIFIALPGMVLYIFVMMALRGAGDSRTPFVFLLLSVGLDVGLNPLLIDGIGPLPGLGIAGSALATLIAQWSTLIGLILWLYRRRNRLCLTGAERAYLRIDRAILAPLVGKGVPMSLQMIVMSSSMIVMISMVNHYGSLTVAAYGACFQLWNYIQMPAFAVGTAASAMAAQNVGARRWDRVGKIAVAGVVYNILLTGALVAVVTLVDTSAFTLFLGDNAGAIAVARRIHLIVSWSFVLFGVSFVLTSVVRATGAMIPPLVIMIVAFWVIRIPAASALSPNFGADAIWWSFPMGSAASLLMTVAYYRYGRWREAKMFSGS